MGQSPRVHKAVRRRPSVARGVEQLESRDMFAETYISLGSVPTNPILGTPFVASLNGRLYFSATTTQTGNELWTSDGTRQGTMLFQDYTPGPAHSYFGESEIAGGKLYFVGRSQNASSGLWAIDGTTKRITTVNNSANAASIGELTRVGSTLFFRAAGGSGWELYKLSSPSNNIELVADINPGFDSFPEYLRGIDNVLYFSASGSQGRMGSELWRSDGTAAGTSLVRDINDGVEPGWPTEFTKLNDVIYFSVNGGSIGRELWRTDGTFEGTRLIRDINPGRSYSSPQWLTNINGTLYFSADDGVHGRELWKSDGTNQGTVMVSDMIAGSLGSDPAEITLVNGELFFTAFDGGQVRQLWRTDGTAAGTQVVSSFRDPLTADPHPRQLTNVNGTLFFSAFTAANGRELWKFDSATSKAVLAKDFNNLGGYAGSDPLLHFVPETGRLFIFTTTIASGRTLYIRDQSPTDVILSSTSIAENSPLGAQVGVFFAKDHEIDETFTYSMADGVGDDDNASFHIEGDRLISQTTFDFEAKASYSIRVRARDRLGLAFEKSLTIAVTDVVLAGDINGDDNVNLLDFKILRANFGINNATFAQGDLNADGEVDILDFSILVQSFGRRL